MPDQPAADMPDEAPEALDLATLEMLADQLDEGFEALVERFGRRLEEAPARIRSACEADERAELAREAHSLKSVAATFGAPLVSRTCAELEAAGEGSEKELEELVGRLERECAAARGAVEAWVARRAGEPASRIKPTTT